MKLVLVLVLANAAAIGCSHDQPVAAPITPAAQAPAAPPAQDAAPATPAPTNVRASHNVSVSADLASACGITEVKDPDPHFDFDKDELTAQDRDVLAKIATCFTTGPLAGRSATLIGRADPRGTEEYNLGLGSRRAHSVGDFLKRLGVKQAQLAFLTRGALDASGTDEAGWKQDRRVDIELKKA